MVRWSEPLGDKRLPCPNSLPWDIRGKAGLALKPTHVKGMFGNFALGGNGCTMGSCPRRISKRIEAASVGAVSLTLQAVPAQLK